MSDWGNLVLGGDVVSIYVKSIRGYGEFGSHGEWCWIVQWWDGAAGGYA